MEKQVVILEWIHSVGNEALSSNEDAFNFIVKFIEMNERNSTYLPVFEFHSGQSKICMAVSKKRVDERALINFTVFENDDVRFVKDFYPTEAEDFILSYRDEILLALDKIKKAYNIIENHEMKIQVTPKIINRVVNRFYMKSELTQTELNNREYALKLILFEGYHLNDTICILENREKWFELDKDEYKLIKKNTRSHIKSILKKWNLKITKNGLKLC